MDGAIGVGLLAIHFTRKRPRAILAGSMQLPAARQINRRMVLGGLSFKVGWGLADYRPSPALAFLATGGSKPVIFTAAMLVGMMLTGCSHGWAPA